MTPGESGAVLSESSTHARSSCGRRRVVGRRPRELELLVARQRRREVHARQHGAGRKPRLARFPAGHVGRIEEDLPHVAERDPRVVQRQAPPADVLDRADRELDRPGVARVAVALVPELPRHQHLAHHRAHVVAALEVDGRHAVDELLVDVAELRDEEAVQLAGQIGGRVRAARERRDEIEAVLHPAARRARRNGLRSVGVDRKGEGLRARVVLPGVVEEGRGTRRCAAPRQIPSGEHARRGVDVGLGVVADAHGEELHDLAAEVLLRHRAGVGAAVEPDQHRRVLGDLDQECLEVAERVVAQHLDLPADTARILARLRGHVARRFGRGRRARQLRVRRREVVVPEERHLLLERAVGVQHPEQPPLLRVGDDGVGLRTPGPPSQSARILAARSSYRRRRRSARSRSAHRPHRRIPACDRRPARRAAHRNRRAAADARIADRR